MFFISYLLFGLCVFLYTNIRMNYIAPIVGAKHTPNLSIVNIILSSIIWPLVLIVLMIVEIGLIRANR